MRKLAKIGILFLLMLCTAVSALAASKKKTKTPELDLTIEESISGLDVVKNAQAGDAQAMCDLGKKYYDGDGVEKNLKKAFSWFYQSAAAGNAEGMLKVGKAYDKGEGVEQDYKEALSWYQRSRQKPETRKL